jgi:flagellar motor protein MotB
VRLVREVGARYFNRALHLAAERKHRDAVDSMLVARTFLAPSVTVSRALGKMYWAAGDPASALETWRSAAAAYPDDDETRRLLATAERRRQTPRPIAAVAIAILATAVVSAAIFGFVARRTAGTHRAEADSPTPALLGSAIPIMPSPASPRPPAQQEDLEALTLRLQSIEGVQIGREGDRVTVVFTGGMFDSASTVTRPADALRLRRAAAAIAAEPSALRIVVRGHADAASPRAALGWRDNWALALERASHALDVLREADASGERVWLASGSTPVEGPFPDASNPALNRTITLTITPE